MGANYGSILVKVNDTQLLKPVLEKIAREQKCKFYLGPVLGGWSSVFPNEYLEAKISDAIARELPNDIFQLTLFDSDVFAYVFYRDGKEQDQYNSCPDYIQEPTEEEKERVRGRPEVFKDLIQTAEDWPKLKEALVKDGYTFEEDRMREFAELLGLRNAIGNYEYLIEGERDEIDNWEQFVHIPDEREAKRQAKERLKAEKQRLKKEGLLLAELLPPGPKRESIHACLHCAADRLNGGFLVGWRAMPEQPLLSFNPLKSMEQVGTGLKLDDLFFSFETSRSGKWLALSHGKTEVWNWRKKTLAFELPPSRGAQLTFTQDESDLIVADSSDISVVSLETGRNRYKFNIGSGGRQCVVLHPEGNYLVAINLRNLCLVNLQKGQVEKTIECKSPQSHELPPGPEADEMITNLQKLYSQKDRLVPDSPHNKLLLESSLSGRTFSIMRTEGIMKFGFNPNGDMLFCATVTGLRVFRWKDLLAAGAVVPPPAFYAVRPKNDYDPTGGYAHDFFLDQQRNQVVFCGSFGKVCYLSLETGKSGILLDPPEDLWFMGMSLASDGIVLGLTCSPNFEERNRAISKFQFWNYPALCKAAGLE